MNQIIAVLCVASATSVGASARIGYPQSIPTFRIFYEGDTGGVSMGGSRIALLDALFVHSLAEGSEPEHLRAGYDALYDSGRYLFRADGGGISALLDFLAGGDIQRGDAVEVDALVGGDAVHLPDLEPDPTAHPAEGAAPRSLLDVLTSPALQEGRFDDLHLERWRLTPCTNAAGSEALLLESPTASADRPVAVETVLWEVRQRIVSAVHHEDGTTNRLITLERRQGEGTRRTAWVREQLAASGENALFVSAGNSVEGRSWIAGQLLNLHRPTSWDALSELLTLLVPAENELAGGIVQLEREARAAGTTLISANLFDATSGEALFSPSSVHELGGVRVAFVGVTDPAVLQSLPPDFAAEIDIADPAAALSDELDRLRTSEQPPDLVVLLTLVEGASLSALLSHTQGVDVVIGARFADRASEISRTVRFVPGSEPDTLALRDRLPNLIAEAGPYVVGRIDGFTAGATLTELRHTERLVDQSWSVIPELISRINQVRTDLYTEWERILFPDLTDIVANDWRVRRVYFRSEATDAYLEALKNAVSVDLAAAEIVPELGAIVFSRGVWLNYLANLIRDRTHADVALVRVLPMPFRVGGPVTETMVHAALQERDELVFYRLNGEELIELLDVRGTLREQPDAIDAELPPPVASGAVWPEEEEDRLVGGRPVDVVANYTVVTTDYLASQPDYAEVLAEHEPIARFLPTTQPGHWRPSEVGERLSLHLVVVDALDSLLREHGTFDQAYVADLTPLLRDQGSQVEPLLILRVPAISFSLSQTTREGALTGYDEVRNTRVNQADSLTLETRVELQLAYDSKTALITAGGLLEYGELRVNEELTETADDLVAFLDLQLRVLDLGLARAFRPYVTSRYDTEVTANEAEEGGDLPRQSELRNSAGMFADFSDIVPEVRAGLFHLNDFAAKEGAQVFGAELSLVQLWTNDVLTQTFDLDALYFFPTDEDSAEDLELSVNARLSLAVSVVGRLAIESFIDAFLFRGKLAINDELGLSLITGVGLTYNDVIRVRL